MGGIGGWKGWDGMGAPLALQTRAQSSLCATEPEGLCKRPRVLNNAEGEKRFKQK